MLATLGSGITMEFIDVPAGPFLMGSAEDDALAFGDERPQTTVTVAGFTIARYPVTVLQFAAFLNATGYQCGAERDVVGWGDYPVTGVGWRDAVAFCKWAARVAAMPLRLPTEAEWEKAARGTDGRLFPWGDAMPDPLRCNLGMHVPGVTIPGRYSPDGDSPYGCADMAGNVWEWTSTLYAPYPYRGDDGREDLTAPGRRVLRGGSWYDPEQLVRCANRGGFNPVPWLEGVGFRCALSASSATLIAS
jgi:formylglycine-generating enzyme required for sulfatase activity